MNITLNGKPHLAKAATVAELVTSLELNVTQVAIEKNLSIVPRIRWSAEPLAEGDQIEVVRLIGGG
ncbi:MAG: sulfur carrier protein ThiS [Rickettsiales bacterium]|jgi:thiamine biosynthesis protein ThiS|nr:sulfur carrier protein ThiS [Rickettsiales bacterium]